jgi:hypothetical protein
MLDSRGFLLASGNMFEFYRNQFLVLFSEYDILPSRIFSYSSESNKKRKKAIKVKGKDVNRK